MIEPALDLIEYILSHHYFVLLCQVTGLVVIIFLFTVVWLRVVLFLWQWYKRPSFRWRGGPNTWAVVTGATEGIGLAYAQQLYQKNYNLLLISRSEDKLQTVKLDIETKYGFKRKIRTLAVDFSSASEDIYRQIETEFDTLDEIHILVNNVGTNYPNERPEFLTHLPNVHKVIMELTNVNMVACTRLTALVLPEMERRQRGVIINLSSFSALFPTPLLALYSATKVYIDYMSRALQEEYRSKGIIIQSVIPYYVSTRMTYNTQPTLFIPTPDRFVRSALKTVGHEEQTAGYFFHKGWNLFYYWLGVASRLLNYNLTIKFAYYRLRAVRNRIHLKEGQLVNDNHSHTDLINVQENCV